MSVPLSRKDIVLGPFLHGRRAQQSTSHLTMAGRGRAMLLGPVEARDDVAPHWPPGGNLQGLGLRILRQVELLLFN